MGLDQHRGQITGEWLDTDTGELQRTRVVPADRAAVRRFLQRSCGRELEVALEATTGWRFVVEELRRIGAEVHLAEPAETAGLRGLKKRAKGDRADARHLRELLMLKRLPESWIPPDHILDLRARVRLRHTLSEQRGEWQQRIQATLDHQGCPQRRGLMVGDGREWLDAQPLPAAAREQVTVALGMIDALDCQLAPLDKELRAFARRQAGCKALMAHYGIGELTAVTILAELGDCTRFSSSRHAVRYAGMDITVHQSDQRRAPGHISRQGPPALRWALYEAAQVARRPGSPDRDYYLQAAERVGGNRACLSVARKLLKRSYHAARTRRGGASARMSFPVRAKPLVTQMRRGQLPACSCRHARVDGPERPSGRNASPSGIPPSHIMSPAPEPTRGSWTKSKAGRPRAHLSHRPRARTTDSSTVHPDNPGPCA
jgi:transposase